MSERPYRGVRPADRQAQRHQRLLAAGLDILGTATDVSELTVRGICGQAGVAARYFYESFNDKDEFVGAVFDWVIADIAVTTQAAVAAAPVDEQSRAAMANIVRIVAGDPRIGRLVFSAELANAVLVRKRADSGSLFAGLLLQHVDEPSQQDDERVKAAVHFVVGGVGQTIAAWLAGATKLTQDRLVDQLASLIEALGDPALYRD